LTSRSAVEKRFKGGGKSAMTVTDQGEYARGSSPAARR
jgi:hypothetical protein